MATVSAPPAPPRSPQHTRLSQLIEASGCSINEFAKLVMGRDPTTLRAYLGGQELPANVARWVDRVQSVLATDDGITVIVRR